MWKVDSRYYAQRSTCFYSANHLIPIFCIPHLHGHTSFWGHVDYHYYRRHRFSNGDPRVLFSRRRVSKQRHCHIRRKISSTRFGVRVCLLVVWCKHFQPPLYSLPKFKIFHCKITFPVKSPICCSRSSTTVAHRIGKIGSANPTVKSVSANNKGISQFGLSRFLQTNSLIYP